MKGIWLGYVGRSVLIKTTLKICFVCGCGWVGSPELFTRSDDNRELSQLPPGEHGPDKTAIFVTQTPLQLQSGRTVWGTLGRFLDILNELRGGNAR